MVWRVGARLHAFIHNLFRPEETDLVREQYRQVAELLDSAGIGTDQARERFIAIIAADACSAFGILVSNGQAQKILDLTAALFDYEQILVLPETDWAKKHTIAELWDIREELTRQRGFAENIDQLGSVLRDAVTEIFRPIFEACPALLDTENDKIDGISVKPICCAQLPILPMSPIIFCKLPIPTNWLTLACLSARAID